jgi:hypothetical protein
LCLRELTGKGLPASSSTGRTTEEIQHKYSTNTAQIQQKYTRNTTEIQQKYNRTTTEKDIRGMQTISRGFYYSTKAKNW